jgi:hypothetical protein
MSGVNIPAAKDGLPLPCLLSRLDLAAHAKRSARCPFHEDHSPSFSVFLGTAGWRWKCHAGCGEGDEIDFLEMYFRISRADAIRRFCDMAGEVIVRPPLLPARATVPNERAVGPRLPDDVSPGTEGDWRTLAQLRCISPFAPARASSLGTLRFGTVCGFRSWIITDRRRLCAEARRLDGQAFPAIGALAARKAHTIRGSVKSWPVGLCVRGFAVSDFRAVLAVEGSPDYLAALHFTLAAESDCLPIAFLGAGAAGAIHPEALALLRGRRVRFYPHHEASGAGGRAVEKWASQLEGEVDAYDFAGLRREDGEAVKDLNDCTRVHRDDRAELEGLLP